MFRFIILACTFSLGFYVGVQQAENPLVVNGPRIIGNVIKIAAEKTEVAKDMSKDGLKTIDTMGDQTIKVVKQAPRVFK